MSVSRSITVIVVCYTIIGCKDQMSSNSMPIEDEHIAACFRAYTSPPATNERFHACYTNMLDDIRRTAENDRFVADVDHEVEFVFSRLLKKIESVPPDQESLLFQYHECLPRANVICETAYDRVMHLLKVGPLDTLDQKSVDSDLVDLEKIADLIHDFPEFAAATQEDVSEGLIDLQFVKSQGAADAVSLRISRTPEFRDWWQRRTDDRSIEKGAD